MNHALLQKLAGQTGVQLPLGYDHRIEVDAHYKSADSYREKAAEILKEAERQAKALHELAYREEEKGRHIHRLCTAGSRTTCCALSSTSSALE